MLRLQGTHANIRTNLMSQKLESLNYIIVAESIRLSSLKFRGGLRKTRVLKQSA